MAQHFAVLVYRRVTVGGISGNKKLWPRLKVGGFCEDGHRHKDVCTRTISVAHVDVYIYDILYMLLFANYPINMSFINKMKEWNMLK